MSGYDRSVQAGGQLGVQVAEDQQVQQGSVRHLRAGQAAPRHSQRPQEGGHRLQEQGHQQDVEGGTCEISVFVFQLILQTRNKYKFKPNAFYHQWTYIH